MLVSILIHGILNFTNRKSFTELTEAIQGLSTFERLATLYEDATDTETLATTIKGTSLADFVRPQHHASSIGKSAPAVRQSG
jgi:hypothetical protein